MPNITIPYRNPADSVIGIVILPPPLALTLAYFGWIVNNIYENMTPAIYENIIVVIILYAPFLFLANTPVPPLISDVEKL